MTHERLSSLGTRTSLRLASSAIALVCSVGCSAPERAPELGTVQQHAIDRVLIDGRSNSAFGRGIALDGDTLMVGGPLENAGVGTVFVYVRGEDDAWLLQDEIAPPISSTRPSFGASVALSEGIAVVGAPLEITGTIRTGAAYVFEKSDDAWTPTATLVPNDAGHGDEVGTTVAFDGTTIVIAAPRHDAPAPSAGAVHVFRRGTDGWTERAQLVASDAAAAAHFGHGLAVDADTIVVGAWTEQLADRGGTYVFRETTDGWTEESKLAGSGGASQEGLGASLALRGDRLLVGAIDTGTDDPGAVIVFDHSTGRWTERSRIVGDAGSIRFGTSIALDDGLVAIGSPNDAGLDGGAGAESAVTVYSMDGWTEIFRRTGVEGFGTTVAVGNGFLFVGNPKDDRRGTDAGAVSLIEIDGKELGEGCADPDECFSGFCVDGVCCDQACGGGSDDDCAACSVAAGATVEGTCAATSGSPCVNACGFAATCDGNALTCPGAQDSDRDGTLDCHDACPNDSLHVVPGICGCNADVGDDDHDGVINCLDECPSDRFKNAPGLCGCGRSDRDEDEDGVADCSDPCPQAAGTWPAGCPVPIPPTDTTPASTDEAGTETASISGGARGGCACRLSDASGSRGSAPLAPWLLATLWFGVRSRRSRRRLRPQARARPEALAVPSVLVIACGGIGDHGGSPSGVDTIRTEGGLDDAAGADSPPGSCGNGIIDEAEMCDSANLGGETCDSATMGSRPLGRLRCSPNCTFATTSCTSEVPSSSSDAAIDGAGGFGGRSGLGASGGTS